MADENDKDDRIPAAEAQDTVVADKGQDTLEADTAETLAGDAADTVQGGAGDDSPFAQFDEPQPAERETVQGAAGDADDGLPDTDIEEAVAELGADTKAAKLLKNLAHRDRTRSAKLKQIEKTTATAAQDAAWSQFERETGLARAPESVRSKLGRTALHKRFKKHYESALSTRGDPAYANGRATAKLEDEVKAIVSAAGTGSPKPRQVHRTETGGTLTPPGGGGSGRAAKPTPAPDKVFIEGDWAYPNPAGEIN